MKKALWLISGRILQTAMEADRHGTVSELAQRLRLHQIDPQISKVSRDKQQTREILPTEGLRQPQSHLVTTQEQAQALLLQPQSPFVLKVTDNSGSRGLSAIDQTMSTTARSAVSRGMWMNQGLQPKSGTQRSRPNLGLALKVFLERNR